MKIQETVVRRISIERAMGLDPVSAIFEYQGGKAGQFTVSCCGKTWTSAWSGLEDGESIEGFLQGCDAGILARRLAPETPDPDYRFLTRIIETVQAALRLRDTDDSSNTSMSEIDRLRGVISSLAGALSSVSQSIEETAAIPDGPIRGEIFMRDGQETAQEFIKRTLESAKPKLKIVA